MARAAAVFMIFIPCRPVGMFRMDPSNARLDAGGINLIVPSKEKTDKGRGQTEFVLRPMDDKNLCPLSLFRLLRKAAVHKGFLNQLWFSQAGSLYKQPAFISLLLKRLLTAAGIPARFAAYSIRHALITYLFDCNMTELQVNAYTGHSQKAHTAATSYFHLDSKWIGRALADGTLRSKLNEKAQSWIVEDSKIRYRE